MGILERLDVWSSGQYMGNAEAKAVFFENDARDAAIEIRRLRDALAKISLLQRDRTSSDTEKIDEAGRIASNALAMGTKTNDH